VRVWRETDPEAAGRLFAEDCVFRSHPFRELEDARAYMRRVLVSEAEVKLWVGKPIVRGSRLTFEYWVNMVEDNKAVTLAGCSLVRLDSKGKCTELRDYWAMVKGRRPPPPEWGH